jgi:cbb3-type cytochrome oxidase cytochrome c subunit
MISTLKLTLAAVAAFAISLPAAAAAQSSVPVDETLAKRGAKLWANNGCYMCHAFGKETHTGPDLAGVMERRDRAWLQQWLKDPYGMLLSDPQAQAMKEQFHDVKMPNYKLQAHDVEALLHFLAKEGQKART